MAIQLQLQHNWILTITDFNAYTCQMPNIYTTPSINHLLYEENAGAKLTMESSSND